MKETENSNRVFGLDLLRCIAILPVIFQHGGMLISETGSNFPWIPLPDGVEIFFVLSGFLIGQILLQQHLKNGFVYFSELRNFWLRRWFRTLPAYYLVLLANVAIIYLGLNGEKADNLSWKFLVFFQNFLEPLQGPFWESWSLAVEEWFYLLFPILLFLISRTQSLSRERSFTLALILFTVVPFILRFQKGMITDVDGYHWDVSFRKMAPIRLDSIAIGIWAAWIKHKAGGNWRGPLGLYLICGFTLFFWLDFNQAETNSMFNKVLRFPVYSICFAMSIPFFDSLKTGPKAIVGWVTGLSKISYSMYLINLGLVASVIHFNFKPAEDLASWGLYIVYWLLVVGISGLLYRYYEAPITALREKF